MERPPLPVLPGAAGGDVCVLRQELSIARVDTDDGLSI